MVKRRAKKRASKPRSPKPTKLHTLSAVSAKTAISMPTLQKYKKQYQRRIPSVGKGRTQRYPEEALAVFAAIKEENLKKRGRPRKKVAKRARKAAATKRPTKSVRRKPVTAKKPAPKLLSLLKISERAGISYPTLMRYVKLYSKQIPHTGDGRKRRYPEAAIEVFEEIRSQSRRPWPKRKAKEPAIRHARPLAKAAKKPAKKKAAKPARKSVATAQLLSLLEIQRRTGISYPTLLRYVKRHGKQIPSKGSGRKRRYPEEAVAVFQKLRSESKRGRKPGAKLSAKKPAKKRAARVATDVSIAARIRALEKSQREITKQLKAVVAELKKPIQVTWRR